MESLIEKVSVYDTRIAPKKNVFALNKGSKMITSMNFQSIGPTTSKQSFVIQAPSKQTFMSRSVSWHSDDVLAIAIKISADANGGYPAADAPIFGYGQWCAFASYPAHRKIQTVDVSVNGNSVQYELANYLDEILRSSNNNNNKYQLTPSALDNHLFYKDAQGTTDGPLGDYSNSTTNYNANGVYSNWYFCDANGVKLGSGTIAGNNANKVPASIDGIPVCSADGATQLAATQTYNIYVRLIVDENLMLPPFSGQLDYDHIEDAGMSEIDKIIINMNLKADQSRLLRSSPKGSQGNANFDIVSCSLYKVQEQSLNVLFLEPSADLPLQTTSVIPYLDFQVQMVETSTGFTNNELTLTAYSLPLTRCPDGFLLYAKPKSYDFYAGSSAFNVADFRYAMKSLSLGFGQSTNQMQEFSRGQIYEATLDNGIDIEAPEWLGSAYQGGEIVPLAGALAYLKVGKNINTGDPKIVSGVNGSFLFNVKMSIINQTGQTPNVNTVMYIVPVYSGFYVSSNGRTVKDDNFVSEMDALEAPEMKDAMTTSDLKTHLVGGGWFSKISNIVKKGSDLFNKGKAVYEASKKYVSPVVAQLDDGSALKNMAKKVGYGQRTGGAIQRLKKKSME